MVKKSKKAAKKSLYGLPESHSAYGYIAAGAVLVALLVIFNQIT